MPSKSFLASKTVWFNFAAVVVAAIVKSANDGEFPPAFQAYAPAVVTVGNIILRFVTHQAIHVASPR